MFIIDDLMLSLMVLFSIRITASIAVFDVYLRDKRKRYAVISLGWLVYAVGPAFGIAEYVITGNHNHPLFGYTAALGSFLLMGGVLLYHICISLRRLLSILLAFTISTGSLLYLIPDMSGHFAVGAQMLIVGTTLAIVVFKKGWFISIAGRHSYNWLTLFLLVSLFHAFGFNFWFSEITISVRFFMTFLTNLFLLLFLFNFDKEQSFLRIKADEEKIAYSLKEKEILLGEVHHRVKNNMAIINSLLNLQIRSIKDAYTQEQLKELQNRIKAMSLVHEKLYLSKDFSRINFKEYIEGLIQNIVETNGEQTNLELNLPPFELKPDTLIPCGLIVNEVLSNSFKHAFKGTSDKKIYLTAHKSENGNINLTIKDNGTGIPKEIYPSHSTGLGLKLVYNLISQLDGKVEFLNDEGAVVRCTFPEVVAT